jgi:hypothetical protein
MLPATGFATPATPTGNVVTLVPVPAVTAPTGEALPTERLVPLGTGVTVLVPVVLENGRLFVPVVLENGRLLTPLVPLVVPVDVPVEVPVAVETPIVEAPVNGVLTIVAPVVARAVAPVVAAAVTPLEIVAGAPVDAIAGAPVDATPRSPSKRFSSTPAALPAAVGAPAAPFTRTVPDAGMSGPGVAGLLAAAAAASVPGAALVATGAGATGGSTPRKCGA